MNAMLKLMVQRQEDMFDYQRRSLNDATQQQQQQQQQQYYQQQQRPTSPQVSLLQAGHHVNRMISPNSSPSIYIESGQVDSSSPPAAGANRSVTPVFFAVGGDQASNISPAASRLGSVSQQGSQDGEGN